MSCGPGMSPRIERKRFLQASDGVNACLPDDSGAQSISSGLLTTCTTPAQAASVFALQVWKAICYLYGLILTIQSQLMRTPGNVNIALGSGLGVGATVSIVGNDTAGQITVDCGVGGSHPGEIFTLTFDTPYTTAGVLVLIPSSHDAISLEGYLANTAVDGAQVLDVGGAFFTPWASQELVFNYYVAGGT